MKTIAFYLPQYHSIPENDAWWGSGFTEWVNVKKARPIYNGHNQPRAPENDNYYNLLDANTFKWQAKLMRSHKIDGLCIYHYHFGGKMLLEKPAELLLANKDIDIEYMFCWANESWTRTWEGDEKEILIKQNYGDKSLWIEHIKYLAKFFIDERYIKIENKPVFVIYKSEEIDELDEMLSVWNDYLKSINVNSIHAIQVIRNPNTIANSLFNNQLKFEPFYSAYGGNVVWGLSKYLPATTKFHLKNIYRSLRKIAGVNSAIMISYDSVWKNIIKNSKKDSFLCSTFVDWDNTARRQNNPTIFYGATKFKFNNYFKEIYLNEKLKGSDFIFVNAWNEWAEGAYLEPDTVNSNSYLCSISEAVTLCE